MHNNTVNDVPYWVAQLKSNSNKIEPLRSKMYENHCTLSTEDQYVLRELVARNASLVKMLDEALSTPAPVKPLWKRLLRK